MIPKPSGGFSFAILQPACLVVGFPLWRSLLRALEAYSNLMTLRPSRKSRFLPGRVFLVRHRQFPIFEQPIPVLTSGCGVPAERRIQPMREPAR
jgi:hypothetical protein